MRVQVTIDIDEEDRRAINARFGRHDSPASRDDVKRYVSNVFWGEMEDVRYEYQNEQSRPDENDDA